MRVLVTAGMFHGRGGITKRRRGRSAVDHTSPARYTHLTLFRVAEGRALRCHSNRPVERLGAGAKSLTPGLSAEWKIRSRLPPPGTSSLSHRRKGFFCTRRTNSSAELPGNLAVFSWLALVRSA